VPSPAKRRASLFENLAMARLDGRFPRLGDKLVRVQLLVLDDWGTHSLNDQQRLDLLEIFEERYRRKSTLITAQLPVAQWHDMIGEPTIADADRKPRHSTVRDLLKPMSGSY
jgi:DNA replication protein DnaC